MIRACPSCGTKNSLPLEDNAKLLTNPKCGKCGANLFAEVKSDHDHTHAAGEILKPESIFADIREIFWPRFSSIQDIDDFLFISGIVLSGVSAIAWAILSIVAGEPRHFIWSIGFLIIGFFIKRGNYWLVLPLAALGVLNFFLRLYVILHGASAGGGLITSSIVAAISIGAIRAWYIKKTSAYLSSLSENGSKSQLAKDDYKDFRISSSFAPHVFKKLGKILQVSSLKFQENKYIKLIFAIIFSVAVLYYIISPYQNCLRDANRPTHWCIYNTNW